MSDLLAVGSELVYREALYLDTQRWDEWLSLYAEDCEYWMPAWKSEHVPTSNPKRELSLMYFSSRSGLEERVWRAREGRAPSSNPLPRTLHLISNLLLDEAASPVRLRVLSNWVVHRFMSKFKDTDTLYGRYEHELVQIDGAWKIAKKKILMLNGVLPAALDFYTL